MKPDRLPRHPLPPAPLAEARPRTLEMHGVSVRDDYSWLRADNWQAVLDDPTALPTAIAQHLERENAHTAQVMRGTGALRRRLAGEMRGRLKEDDADPSVPDGPFAYYTRFRPGGQYPLVCRQPRDGGEEAILVDGDREADGQPYFEFGETAHSPDHRLLAGASDLKGSELFTIRIRDLESGRDLPDEVFCTEGDAVWLGDGSGFYYVSVDETLRPSCIRRHRLGRPVSEDETVYEERDSGFFLSVDRR
jgi:oligopeptidase B